MACLKNRAAPATVRSSRQSVVTAIGMRSLKRDRTLVCGLCLKRRSKLTAAKPREEPLAVAQSFRFHAVVIAIAERVQNIQSEKRPQRFRKAAG